MIVLSVLIFMPVRFHKTEPKLLQLISSASQLLAESSYNGQWTKRSLKLKFSMFEIICCLKFVKGVEKIILPFDNCNVFRLLIGTASKGVLN